MCSKGDMFQILIQGTPQAQHEFDEKEGVAHLTQHHQNLPVLSAMLSAMNPCLCIIP